MAGHSHITDWLMVMISRRSRFVYLLVFVYLVSPRKANKKLLRSASVSFVVAYLVSVLLKLMFNRKRPFLKHGVYLLPPVPSKNNSSFPSKHTVLAFALSAVVYVYHRMAGIGLSLLSFLVGFSRIWMGQHYPFDILGSAILGNVISYAVKMTEKVWVPIYNRLIRFSKEYISSLSFNSENK